MECLRHFGDDFVAHKHRKDKERDKGEEFNHFVPSISCFTPWFTICPFSVIRESLYTSSSLLMFKKPFLTIPEMKCSMFFAYNSVACTAMVEGIFFSPINMTPCFSTVSPGTRSEERRVGKERRS